jgi:crotonobetainyl-CoA:carnitine CoA-transferase CaiB-like acyl-CoA transferase
VKNVRDYFEWAKSLTDPAKVHEKPEALEGIRVLDISYGNFAALFASSILAELGAEVIKIEPPEGDIARKMTPFGIKHKDTGLAFLAEGRNKYYITLNVYTERGKELYKKMVKKSDVVIESFKPGEADELGIGYKNLAEENPRLIYAAISTTGSFGPGVKKMRSYDIIEQARSTLMYMTGEAEFDPEVPEEYKIPLREGNWLGWYTGGAWTAYGILLAIFWREKSGKGQFIDVSPCECLLRHSNYFLQYYHESKRVVPRSGPYDPAVFAYTVVKSRDSYVFIAGYSDPNWKGLTDLIGRPDLFERFPTPKERLVFENQIEMRKEIEKWSLERESDEIIRLAQEHNLDETKTGTVVVGKVYSPKQASENDAHYERDILKIFRDPYYGELLVQGSSFGKMSETPGRIKWLCRPIGADNVYIYAKVLGLDAKDLKLLKETKVI